MAALGFRKWDEMIGRVDVLDTDAAIKHWKADGIDLSSLLTPAQKLHPDSQVRCVMTQDHGLDESLDRTQLVPACQPAIQDGKQVRLELPIVNTDRTAGTILSHEVTKRWGADGLPEGTIHLKFNGSAGQSLGAWLTRGITIEVEGDCNDYVGKGLSGGRVIVYPPKVSSFAAEDQILVGNVCLYGSTSGKAFFRGRAAERFCVRNSGAWAVVEGVGDHGCEYMTGGRAIIIGPTGRNFAAGMSGGVAYVWAPDRDAFRLKCNLGTVELEDVVDEADKQELHDMLVEHQELTESAVASRILSDWEGALKNFVKVMPTDYKRVLAERAAREAKPSAQPETV
jgi:glutamate synthase (NADPH/NADH) large chain